MRRSSTTVALGITALMASSLTGCANNDNYRENHSDYAQVCKDNKTGNRLPDDQCNNRHSSSAGWYFIPIYGGRSIPPVGSRVSSGQASLPQGKTASRVSSQGGNYAKSGSVSRGGFGSGAKGGSGS